MSSGMFAQNKLVGAEADGFRFHDFIGHGIFQYTVLMNPRLMGKCVGTDNGLIGLYDNAGDHANQPTGWMDVLGINGSCQP